MNNVIEKLKNLGFNSYEAKVYLALLKKSPATGYEIANLADIPQARAYDALKSLEIDKIVVTTGDKPLKYQPIAPKELTTRFKRKMNATIDYLNHKLINLNENYNEPVHNIFGYENIVSKAKEIINNAKSSIYAEIWECDFRLIENELHNAYEKDIDIKIVGFDNLKSPFGILYSHAGTKETDNNFARMIFLLADSKECLFGSVENETVWTQNKNIAMLLKQFIVHDMYLLDVEQNFPEQLKYFYGVGFKKLKNKILSHDTDFNIY